jgi:hypothetical protein
VYWIGVYALFAMVIFAVVVLLILPCYIWCEVKAWFQRRADRRIGIAVAVPTALANGGSDK